MLLVLIVGGMLTAFYFYERKVQIEQLDERIRAPIHHLLPLFDLPRGIVEMRDQQGAEGRAYPDIEGTDEERPRPRRPRFQEGDGEDFSPDGARSGDFRPGAQGPNGQRRPRPARNFQEGDEFSPRWGRSEGSGPGMRGQELVDISEQGEPDSDQEDALRGPREGGYTQATVRLGEQGLRRLSQIEQGGIYIIYWRNGEVAYKSTNSPESPDPPQNLDHREREKLNINDVEDVMYRDNGKHREFLQRSPRGWVITGISTDVVDEYMHEFGLKLLGIGVGIIIFGVVVGWIMASRAIRPIAAMSTTATKIAHGDLSQRIDETNTKNELGQLAQVLNETFGRLDSSFEQQVRFTADASHEMRTPLAVILAKSELALVRDRSTEKYKETIQACHDSAQHMSSLIDSLLELARVDSGEFRVNLYPGNIGETVRDCVEMLRPLAEQRGIHIESDIQGVSMSFDAQRIKQVVINLLSNAVKYNHDNGKIIAKVFKQGESAVISISDTGPGIKEEDLKHVFDRFYRVDKARNAKQGSTGLGLAISQAIVVSHGGKIQAESEYGVGTTFRVVLPIK